MSIVCIGAINMTQINGYKPTKEEQVFVNTLVRLHSESSRLGLFKTCRSLNQVIQMVGFEIADKVNKDSRKA